MKSIAAINPAITENMKYLIAKAGASFIDLNVGVCGLIMVYHYASFHF